MRMRCVAGCVLFCVAVAAGLQAAQVQYYSEPRPLPGVELAHGIATATGIAVTPLFGVCGLGAWDYFKTEPAKRGQLPWFNSPWFWATGLLVVLLVLCKDFFLGLLPVAKKPLDAVELLENKGSAILATPAITSLITAPILAAAHSGPGGLTQIGSATGSGGPGFTQFLLAALAVIAVLSAFLIIWLVFHAVNVLILLSPFGPLDLLLRGMRFLVLIFVAVAAWISPYLGLLVSLVVLGIACLVAGWSFRLMVFGAALAWDLVTFKHRRYRPEPARYAAFTCRRFSGVPVRTLGIMERQADGRFCLRYRRRFLSPRTLELPNASYTLKRGVLSPVLVAEDGRSGQSMLRLLPRCRSHEERIARLLELPGPVDFALARNLKGLVGWIREVFGPSRTIDSVPQ